VKHSDLLFSKRSEDLNDVGLDEDEDEEEDEDDGRGDDGADVAGWNGNRDETSFVGRSGFAVSVAFSSLTGLPLSSSSSFCRLTLFRFINSSISLSFTASQYLSIALTW